MPQAPFRVAQFVSCMAPGLYVFSRSCWLPELPPRAVLCRPASVLSGRLISYRSIAYRSVCLPLLQEVAPLLVPVSSEELQCPVRAFYLSPFESYAHHLASDIPPWVWGYPSIFHQKNYPPSNRVPLWDSHSSLLKFPSHCYQWIWLDHCPQLHLFRASCWFGYEHACSGSSYLLSVPLHVTMRRF